MIREVEATREIALAVAMDLKESDQIEIAQYGLGYRPEVQIPEWSALPGSLAWVDDRGPIAVGGLNENRPWLFTTPRIKTVRLAAHKLARAKIARWTEDHGLISNFVSSANQDSIVWLYALGARFAAESVRFSPTGGRFIRFWWG